MVQYTKEEDMRSLLCQIHGFYEAALDLLPAERIPSLAPRLLRAGVCLGVLNPVSIIIANTVAYSPSSNPHPKDEEEAAVQLHTRESVIRPAIARRPRELLVFYFRYLAKAEALRYLRLAEADLLAAVRLIERDRNNIIDDPQKGRFGFSVISLTTKVAMGCAAVSARHPDADILIRTSQLLSSFGQGLHVSACAE
ncbi:hypothetical protein PR202_gb25976 [Eleusine coracana subsp. coracana]|uniref:PIR2-like helical domain-containing protein n=1 Tax=Eleusine coracana subsp. coracana TaxID=191504 RepID=A0AAV5FQN1_ELECO|nr:hypothetical protein PR202_gb25976 [Eleusine coracana subsp. coracana]